MLCRIVQFGLASDAESQMVEPAAVLMEAVGRDGSKADQRTAEVVDHAAEQEAQRLAGGLVGAVGRFDEDAPSEDALVELSRPLDVSDGQPDVRNGRGGDRHGFMLPVAAAR